LSKNKLKLLQPPLAQERAGNCDASWNASKSCAGVWILPRISFFCSTGFSLWILNSDEPKQKSTG
jgi:hypothetical protein